MASVRKRGAKWQVQVRRDGFPPISKTFHLKEDAQRWAREQERLIDLGGVAPASLPTYCPQTLAGVLGRYRSDILPAKRAAGTIESFHLRAIEKHPIAKLPLGQVTAVAIAGYRDLRLTQVSASTVRRELGLLQHALRIARDEWGLSIPEVKTIKKPPANKPRERRLAIVELTALDSALRQCRNPLVRPVFLFALATGMRRGEVLSLTLRNIDLNKRTAFLPITKNGHSRTVPLSSAALAILEKQALEHGEPPRSRDAKCFPISQNALRLAWERVKRRAKVEDLHFHDLRHEAISRFFEMGLSIPEVSLISGHRDPRMLFRYTHLRAEDIASKLHPTSCKTRADGPG